MFLTTASQTKFACGKSLLLRLLLLLSLAFKAWGLCNIHDKKGLGEMSASGFQRRICENVGVIWQRSHVHSKSVRYIKRPLWKPFPPPWSWRKKISGILLAALSLRRRKRNFFLSFYEAAAAPRGVCSIFGPLFPLWKEEEKWRKQQPFGYIYPCKRPPLDAKLMSAKGA